MTSTPETRTILAHNIRRMIDAATPLGAKPSIRAWALSKGVSVRLVDRLVKGKHAVTLDTLEELAAAIGVQPWHLLLPDLDPADPPDSTITAEDAALLKRLRRILDK